VVNIKITIFWDINPQKATLGIRT